MANRLAGKVALITGAASGIGRTTALLFAQEGAKVVAGDLNMEGNEQTVEMIKEAGGEALAVALNVVHAKQVEQAIATTVEQFGSLDILCNNAGTGEMTSSIIEMNEKDWDRVIAVNLKGVFLGIKYGAAQMIKADKGGVIINTASMAGLRGFPLHAAYASSKAAVIHLTKTAALELTGSKIRVNAIAPAFIDTPMVDSLVAMAANKDRARQRLALNQPLGRLGTVEEVANTLLFLASDESSFITGTVISIDGGATA